MNEKPFTQAMREAAADPWRRMQEHQFVVDIEADRLPQEVFHRYLVYENDFVETAIVIFGHLLVKAPDLATRRRIVSILAALSGEQIAYFRRTFETIGISPQVFSSPSVTPAVSAFRDGMLRTTADGTYLQGVAAMYAAESMYLEWCSRAARRLISDPLLREWVALHAVPDFAGQAKWLGDQLDAAAPVLDEPAREDLVVVFAHALELEIAFHAAAYE